MIKMVPVSLLRPGMFVHDLNCSWLKHPFMNKRFLIEEVDTLRKIREIGVGQIYIDTGKGLDIAPDEPEREEISEPATHSLSTSEHREVTGPGRRTGAERACRILGEANRLLRDIMSDVKLGKQIEVKSIKPVVTEMVSTIFDNQDALMALTRVRQRDEYTFQHSLSVTVLLVAFARTLGMSREEAEQFGIGGIVHDIGKTRTPDHILNKPARLTEDEFRIMREHVVHSRTILEETPGISAIAMGVAAEHHERWDGTGYPLKLKGEQITLAGRMAAIVDVYDALTADRVYHKGKTPRETLAIVVKSGGNHFDPDLVKQFVHSIGIYPVGSLVQLESRRLAVVLASNRESLSRPTVRPILDIRHRAFIVEEDIDLASPSVKDRIISSESEEQWNLRPEQFMGVGEYAAA